MKRYLCLLILLAALHGISSEAQSQQVPFRRGVNLTNWFQASGPRQIQFMKYLKSDFTKIQSLGFDVIRLPINLHYMTGGEPDYMLDTLFLGFLDQAVDWAEELEMHLILDNHTFDPSESTVPEVGIILKKVWSQMADHFKDRSAYLCYEVLNEPHGIDDAIWNTIQQEVIEEIRLLDTTHYIVVGPAGWNSYNNLKKMPHYTDKKLIYTFHFYDPFLFTHQGASWTNPSMEPLRDIPFPCATTEMPALPSELQGTWIEHNYNNYQNEGTIEKVKSLIDIAIAFRDQRNVPIFCGEFGVYQPNSDPEERVFWYDVVQEYLDSNRIAWTMWDYHGGFGLFERGSNGMFEHDLNISLLEALDLEIPEQTEYTAAPDSTGLMIYGDYLSGHIRDASYSIGELDYYHTSFPNNGEYCIHWTGASQYHAIVMDLRPNRDLSVLVNNGFALDLIVRGSDPEISFDVRFVDSKTDDPSDLPWRMGATVNGSVTSFDGKWHHLHLPLTNFREKGAWYDGTWYNPDNRFNWSEVDRLEIVPEAKALGDAHLYFDNIHLTDRDTATVRQDITGLEFIAPPFSQADISLPKVQIYPNPTSGYVVFHTGSSQPVNIRLLDPVGRVVLTRRVHLRHQLELSFLPDGLYIAKFSNDSGATDSCKLLLQ